MEQTMKSKRIPYFFRRKEWRLSNDLPIIFLFLILFTWQANCHELNNQNHLKNNVNSLVKSADCHNCTPNSSDNLKTEPKKIFKNINKNIVHETKLRNNFKEVNELLNKSEAGDVISDTVSEESFIDDLLTTIEIFSDKIIGTSNKTEKELEDEVLHTIDDTLKRDYYEIADGIEIKPIGTFKGRGFMEDDVAENTELIALNEKQRSIFSKFGFERRVFNRIRTFFENHILSISLPKAAQLVGLRSFGLKKFLWPLLLGAQLVKGFLVAMFLPSILGSFGKIVGKGLSHLSAASSQASYPPQEEPEPYDDATGQKDVMGLETDPQGVYTAYHQDGQMTYATADDINTLGDLTMSRYGPGGAKVSYLPNKNNDYYKNQISNTNYKIFHKIPASSMILSNYDPFYSPILSRLDGIFARLGLSPTEGPDGIPSGQTVSSIKLEACREQIICLMYASPAKYAPYSNLISAQLSRELNELRRPTSDNAEILRFFRYMRAARQGQEGIDCLRAHPSCVTQAEPSHTMISAYHDINKLVTARKLK